MELKKLTLCILSSSSLALVGCGGDSAGEPTPEIEALSAYTDLTWSAGADELVGLTYPAGASNGPLVALKRSTGSDDSVTHTLMTADADTKEFVAVEGVTLDKNYYRDVLALPVSGTFEGESIDTVLVATCGYAEASYLEGGELPDQGSGLDRVSALANERVALQPTEEVAVPTVTPAVLSLHLLGTDFSAEIDITDVQEPLSLVDCHSLGGLYVADLSSKGRSSVEVSLFLTGLDQYGEYAILEAGFGFDYDTFTLGEYGFGLDQTNMAPLGAIEEDPEDDYFFTAAFEGNTYLLDDMKGEARATIDGNPFSGSSQEGALITDLVLSGNTLLGVSADAGLAGIDFGGEEIVMLSEGDYANCIDQLALNGNTVWCHDATEEGTLIEFTVPEVPQSEVMEESQPEVVARKVAIGGGSKEEAEQIKAELEGAGAEVEVK